MLNKLQVINAIKPINYNKFKVKVSKKDSIKTAEYSLKLKVNSSSVINSYSNKYDYETVKIMNSIQLKNIFRILNL